MKWPKHRRKNSRKATSAWKDQERISALDQYDEYTERTDGRSLFILSIPVFSWPLPSLLHWSFFGKEVRALLAVHSLKYSNHRRLITSNHLFLLWVGILLWSRVATHNRQWESIFTDLFFAPTLKPGCGWCSSLSYSRPWRIRPGSVSYKQTAQLG